MSGFDIIAAVAAGLQIAEQAFKIVGRIRKKIRDPKELTRLKTECEEATTQLDKHINSLSPGAKAAANHLRDRLKIVAQNIDRVAAQEWYVKLANLWRVWNTKFVQDVAEVTDKFRTSMVIEANKLLQSINVQQEIWSFASGRGRRRSFRGWIISRMSLQIYYARN